ncbi:hypothetical protein BDQ12DRAFT_675104 [Crucibulum laeve]|uniref:Uncharacterized protein n=1 Tax=Crucibulum laeve TaxID=68775 RepID=A0A5C3MHT8_9AGAR|nr:hypothetical protein BDQ12DRAFT_675104 [Crucibulum laeve]
MPLFRDHPLRSVATAAIALSIGHFATKLLSSPYAFHLTQTSVAILAIAGLIVMVTLHHRREGQLLTQTQEEMVLIGGLALFWVVTLVAWRALTQRGGDTSVAGGLGFAKTSPAAARQEDIYDAYSYRPYPCSPNDDYCVVEEYSYW